jgi:hypothetical protein
MVRNVGHSFVSKGSQPLEKVLRRKNILFALLQLNVDEEVV